MTTAKYCLVAVIRKVMIHFGLTEVEVKPHDLIRHTLTNLKMNEKQP